MHSITLEAGSGILLLSSIFYLVYFLKKISKSSLNSSTTVLSISDFVNSILTAVMMLVYQFYYNHENYFNQLSAKGNQSIELDDLLAKNSLYFRQVTVNPSDGENCDNKSVFFQYAIFFVPFANAFISLMCFSLSFYANASKVNRKCCKLMANQDKIAENQTVTKRRKLKFFDSKFTGIAVISQWLLPVLIGAVFQSGQYEKIKFANESSDELICSLAANFPLENWMSQLRFENDDQLIGMTASENYVGDEENLAWPNPNSSKVHDVLTKVYQVIREAQNSSETSTKKTSFYNITQILDIANIKDDFNSSVSVNHDSSDENYVEIQDRLFESALKKSFEKNKESSLSRKYKAYSRDLLENTNLRDEHEITSLNNFESLQSMTNRCIVSVTFLKVNLFIFLSLIYFVPILVSSLLLVVSFYKCRETYNRLLSNDETKNIQLKMNVETTNKEVEREPNPETSSSTGWFSAKTDETVTEGENQVECSEFDKIICELSCKTERTQNFLSIFKIHILAAVVLWTPFFVYVLSKVFFCSDVPNWLTETAFLATVVFVVFRNAVYVNIFKMEIEDPKKNNSVHPNPRSIGENPKE